MSGVLRAFGRTRVAAAATPTVLLQRFPIAAAGVRWRGMAKAAGGDAKAAPAADAKAGAGDKKDAKTGVKPNEKKSQEEKMKEDEVRRKAALAALIVKGPKVHKGQRWAPDQYGPQAAVRSRFPAPIAPPLAPNPDDRLRWRIAGAAIVERVPLKPEEPSALDNEWAALIAANEKRHVPRYTPPATAGGKKPAAGAAGAAPGTTAAAASIEAEGEGEGGGWGSDEVDDDEAANRKRLAEEAEERDPVRRAAIDSDPKNIRRKRTERLYLIVKKPRPAAEHDWGFPQGGVDAADSKSLRATAERELSEECGAGLHVHAMGNAPIGHLQYKFKPEVVQKLQRDGQKVYYHHMLYLEGDVTLDRREVVDFAWATKHELINQYFTHSPELVKLTQQILP